MAIYWFIKYSTGACLSSRVEAPERFVRFAFDNFKPTKKEPKAELLCDGNVIATKEFRP